MACRGCAARRAILKAWYARTKKQIDKIREERLRREGKWKEETDEPRGTNESDGIHHGSSEQRERE